MVGARSRSCTVSATTWPSGSPEGQLITERNVYELAVHVLFVKMASMLQELFAMVAENHHQRIVSDSQLRQLLEHPAELGVGPSDRAVVPVELDRNELSPGRFPLSRARPSWGAPCFS